MGHKGREYMRCFKVTTFEISLDGPLDRGCFDVVRVRHLYPARFKPSIIRPRRSMHPSSPKMPVRIWPGLFPFRPIFSIVSWHLQLKSCFLPCKQTSGNLHQDSFTLSGWAKNVQTWQRNNVLFWCHLSIYKCATWRKNTYLLQQARVVSLLIFRNYLVQCIIENLLSSMAHASTRLAA